MKTSEIFEKEPVQWGLRGDPYLWQELKERLKETDPPNTVEELEKTIIEAYEKATGHQLSHQKPFVVARFKHGGMSSGEISPDFWKTKGVPLLVSRYVKV